MRKIVLQVITFMHGCIDVGTKSTERAVRSNGSFEMSTRTVDRNEGFEAPLSVSPRDVLSLLNQMGIREVSAPQLKDFMLDLKKLMHSETQFLDDFKENAPHNLGRREGPERLHSCTTISSRSKMVTPIKTKHATPHVTSRVIPNPKPQSDVRQKDVKTVKSIKKDNIIIMPTSENVVNVASKESIKSTTHRKMKSSKNFIKVPLRENPKKSDPVTLYHQYSALWQKYKTNLPGENNRADIRWSVREKLLGDKQSQDVKKVTKLSQESLEIRREGWID